LYVGVVLWGVHLGLTQGVISALIADVAPGELRGTAFGVFNLVSGLVLLGGSAGAGLMWDRITPAAPFYAGAGIALLGALATFALPRQATRPA
jgi:MFS family permease